MKQVLITLVFMAVYTGLFSQNESNKILESGAIIYEQVIKMDIQLEGDAAEYAHLIPKERKTKKVLYFNNKASLFQNLKEENSDDIENMHTEGMVIRMEEPDDILYTDLISKKQTEQKEFMTRMFLIESDINLKGWKITGNRKTVLDYNCQEAVKMKDSVKVIAWFTPEIPVSIGPGHLIGLPGAILEVEFDEGNMTISATEVKKETIDETNLIKPKKGKKVTEEEFKAIVDEKIKEMGGSGNTSSSKFIIKIHQD